jgi:hypothetical protein
MTALKLSSSTSLFMAYTLSGVTPRLGVVLWAASRQIEGLEEHRYSRAGLWR